MTLSLPCSPSCTFHIGEKWPKWEHKVKVADRGNHFHYLQFVAVALGTELWSSLVLGKHYRVSHIPSPLVQFSLDMKTGAGFLHVCLCSKSLICKPTHCLIYVHLGLFSYHNPICAAKCVKVCSHYPRTFPVAMRWPYPGALGICVVYGDWGGLWGT